VSDSEGRELYLDYARQDRCAMWGRIPYAEDVPQALRVLADRDYVHTRYTGPSNRPTSTSKRYGGLRPWLQARGAGRT
jgi:hypothetical protein